MQTKILWAANAYFACCSWSARRENDQDCWGDIPETVRPSQEKSQSVHVHENMSLDFKDFPLKKLCFTNLSSKKNYDIAIMILQRL